MQVLDWIIDVHAFKRLLCRTCVSLSLGKSLSTCSCLIIRCICSALHSAVHTHLHTILYFQVRTYSDKHTIGDQPSAVVLHLVKHHLVDETATPTVVVVIRLRTVIPVGIHWSFHSLIVRLVIDNDLRTLRGGLRRSNLSHQDLYFAGSLGETCDHPPQFVLLELRVADRLIRRGVVWGIPGAIQKSEDLLTQGLARGVVTSSLLDCLALVASCRLALTVLVEDVRTQDPVALVQFPRTTFAAL